VSNKPACEALRDELVKDLRENRYRPAVRVIRDVLGGYRRSAKLDQLAHEFWTIEREAHAVAEEV